MFVRIGLLAAFLLFAATAQANNGATLLLQCEEAEQVSRNSSARNELAIGMCLGMVQGVALTMESMNSNLPPHLRTCFPDERLTGVQASRIVLKFLRENPELLHEAAAYLAILAFHKAFPCAK